MDGLMVAIVVAALIIGALLMIFIQLTSRGRGQIVPEGLAANFAQCRNQKIGKYADGDNEGGQVAGQSYARLRRGWRNDGRTYEISQGILER